MDPSNYEPSALRDAFVALLFLALWTWLIWDVAWYFGFFNGYQDGRVRGENEERSHRNAIIIRAKLAAFKDGVVAGMGRVLHGSGKN